MHFQSDTEVKWQLHGEICGTGHAHGKIVEMLKRQIFFFFFFFKFNLILFEETENLECGSPFLQEKKKNLNVGLFKKKYVTLKKMRQRQNY